MAITKLGRIRHLTWVAAALLPVSGLAAEVLYSLDAGVGRSNNINRVALNEQEETIYSAGLQLSVLEQSRLLEADISASANYYDYAENTFQSEVLGNARGNVALHLFDERLSWVVADSYGQTQRDLFSAPTPDNLESINYFSTGPDFNLRLPNDFLVRAQFRYSLVSYEDSPLDSNRYSGQMSFGRRMSPTTELLLLLGDERIVSANGAAFQSYDRQQGYLRYGVEAARTNASVDLGVGRLGTGSSETYDPMLRLMVQRRVGRRATVGFEAGHLSTDPASAFSNNLEVDFNNPADQGSLSQTASTYVRRYVGTSLGLEGRRTRIDLGANWSTEDYGQGADALNRSQLEVSLGLTREFGPRLSGRFTYAFADNDFDIAGADYGENTAILGLDWRMSRTLFVDFSVEHFHTDQQLLTAGSSAEQRAWVRIRHGGRLGRSREPR